MNKDYKHLKLWQGLVVLASAALIILVISPRFLAQFGLYGTLLGEWLMLAVALGLVLLFKGNLKELLPLKRPTGSGIFGTILIWVGTFLIEMVLILILSIFFSERILNVNVGLSYHMINVPFIAAFLIVAVTPAICEEAVFRGVFLNSLKPQKYKWAAIVICGAVFGIFHGDVFRFVPTAISGAVMAYLLLESGNMVYNSLFHFVNNLVPVVVLFSMGGVYGKMNLWSTQGTQDMTATMGSSAYIMGAGLYMMMSAAAPSCIYIGNYLLHSHTPGYRDKLFPSGKPGIVIFLIVSSLILFFGGILLMFTGIINMQGALLP